MHTTNSSVQKCLETLPRILSARKDLVKGHLSKSVYKSVDKEPKAFNRILEIVFIMSRVTKVCPTQSQVLFDVVLFTRDWCNGRLVCYENGASTTQFVKLDVDAFFFPAGFLPFMSPLLIKV